MADNVKTHRSEAERILRLWENNGAADQAVVAVGFALLAICDEIHAIREPVKPAAKDGTVAFDSMAL